MPTLPTASVDLVVTSPPYHRMGKEYETDCTFDQYLEWADRWVSHIPRLLTRTGTAFINLGFVKVSPSQAHPLSWYYKPVLERHGLHILQSIVWAYGGG